MLARRILMLLIAAMLVGRGLHCLYTEALLCSLCVVVDAAAGAPLADPNEADPNETGCLCKGALIDAPQLLANVEEAAEQAHFGPAIAPHPLFGQVAEVSAHVGDGHLLGPPPPGGRALRAWIASLQI